jgi:hypothetical protein
VVVQDTVGVGSLIMATCMLLLAIPASFLALRTWRAENEAKDARDEAARFQRQMKAWVQQEKRNQGADD